MNIVHMAERNTEYKLILTNEDLQMMLARKIKKEISVANMIGYVSQVAPFIKLAVKSNFSMLAIPTEYLMRIYKFNNIAYLSSSVSKISHNEDFTNRFLQVKLVKFEVQCRIIIKLDRHFIVVVISKMKEIERRMNVFKIMLYYPKLLKQFQFFLYSDNVFSAEIGLHKQAIERGSKFSNALGFRSKDIISKQFLQQNSLDKRRLYKQGTESSKLLFGMSQRNMGHPKRIDREEAMDDSLNLGVIDHSFAGSNRSIANASIRNISIAKNAARRFAALRKKKDEPILEELKTAIEFGFMKVTPQNVLVEYDKYELKSIELIREEVMNHRKVNLKYTRECVLIYAGERNINSVDKRLRYKKFYTAFYWRCMMQMLKIDPKGKYLSVSLSKLTERLMEIIFEIDMLVDDQLYRVTFATLNSTKKELQKTQCSNDDYILVEVENISIEFIRRDVVTYRELIDLLRLAYFAQFKVPSKGNMRIACRRAARNIRAALSLVPFNSPSQSVFLDGNLKVLLESPIWANIKSIEYKYTCEQKKQLVIRSFLTSGKRVTKRYRQSADLPTTGKLILLHKKLFMSSPRKIVSIFYCKEKDIICFVFHQLNQCTSSSVTFEIDSILHHMPLIRSQLNTCSFQEIGSRLFGFYKNSLLLSDYISLMRSASLQQAYV